MKNWLTEKLEEFNKSTFKSKGDNILKKEKPIDLIQPFRFMVWKEKPIDKICGAEDIKEFFQKIPESQWLGEIQKIVENKAQFFQNLPLEFKKIMDKWELFYPIPRDDDDYDDYDDYDDDDESANARKFRAEFFEGERQLFHFILKSTQKTPHRAELIEALMGLVSDHFPPANHLNIEWMENLKYCSASEIKKISQSIHLHPQDLNNFVLYNPNLFNKKPEEFRAVINQFDIHKNGKELFLWVTTPELLKVWCEEVTVKPKKDMISFWLHYKDYFSPPHFFDLLKEAQKLGFQTHPIKESDFLIYKGLMGVLLKEEFDEQTKNTIENKKLDLQFSDYDYDEVVAKTPEFNEEEFNIWSEKFVISRQNLWENQYNFLKDALVWINEKNIENEKNHPRGWGYCIL